MRALPPLPPHVGVLQRLGRGQPLVRGEHQKSPEEIQGLQGRVSRQEGLERLARPAVPAVPVLVGRLLPGPAATLWPQQNFVPVLPN